MQKGKLTQQERANLARCTADATREAYEREGEEGDFDDAARYLRDDASDAELREEYNKWVKN